ncbi:S26 family signal peptidase [Actinoplanes teichomyceticus]|uniref:S26 family signal peptidase n=1 Tax=Actinoplanes teichomyceticus TaxID=1867 RepID=UPI0011EAD285|nr:S26 family signal peptidase [Actinoplanes teichomyceticus]
MLAAWGVGAAGCGALLLLLVVALLAVRRRVTVVDVCGVSMQPTLQPGERVLARRVPAGRLRAGDIVVYQVTELLTRASAPERRYGRSWRIKRVAAGPGEPVPEPIAEATGSVAGAVVPDRVILVLGDNAARSVDSRHTGPVPWADVYGVVWRKLSVPPAARQPRPAGTHREPVAGPPS